MKQESNGKKAEEERSHESEPPDRFTHTLIMHIPVCPRAEEQQGDADRDELLSIASSKPKRISDIDGPHSYLPSERI